MTCAGCGLANPAGARFCAGCGASLAPRCPSCGAEGPAAARFCIACGAPLATRPADAAAERKVVTILFADLIGSTALHEGLDPESVNRLMDRYYRAVRAAVEAHKGTVVQLLGDGVMCAFGVPRVAEDDAIRAVRAGVEVQRAFREFAAGEGAVTEQIGLRVAINTGEVVVSDDFAAGIGDPLNVAARLQQEAQDGDVLISGSTQRLVADRVTLAPVGRFALKGRAEPVAAYRVVSLERPAGAAAVAFVGREAELARLTSVYAAAVAAPAARLAVVLGSPGLGKSRLLAELGRRLGDRATVLLAQCRAAGGASFAPLAEALRAQLGIEEGSGGGALRAAIDAIVPGEEAERARIANGIGALLAGTPAAPEESFFVVRRLLAALAAQRPVVLAIDDLHWAEPLLLDLTEHLVQWGAGVPLLVLAAARPELRDARSSLATPGGLVADAVTLAGLDANEATRLAASVIGAEALPAAVAGRVLATSEGNPLFVGELVRMLVQDGALRREGDRWTTAVELADLEMPPTIQALLAARIERLRPEDRLVLERASVVGRQFSRAALTELLPAAARAELGARLEALRRSELIEPDTGWLLGEPALRFHHVLIRDAAYRRVLKETRAELHERLADWIAARAGESVEHDETIGWHLEQAHQNLRELGPLDEQARALGERAARRLAAAGQRALARDDLLPAAGLLGRALDRLPGDDPTRADLTLDWCEALLGAGDVAGAAHAIAELARLMPESDRLRAWHTCFSGQLAVLTDPKGLRASEAAVAAAAETLAAAGDAVGEAKAHTTHAQVLASLGKIGACESALDRALAAARRVNDRRRANVVLAGAPLAALWGPSPVTRASGRCLDVVRVLRITQGAPAVEAVALRCQAVLETLRGRGEAARRMIASARKLVEELGITQRVLETDHFAGLIELLEGDAPAAERWLRAAFDGLREQGLGIEAANAGALLSRALLAQGRVDEAEAVSRESESLAGDSFKPAIAWRGVRAEVLAARGDHAAAIELARAGVEIAAATDDLLDHADARSSLAVALRAAGHSAEADAEERRAIELWEAKGATLLTERARRATTAASARAARAPVEAAAPPRATRPRVERNHATLQIARIDEAVAARDLEAVRWLLGQAEALDHKWGRSYGADSILERFRWMIERSAGLAYGNEPIAVLGPSLALTRWRESGSGEVGDELPIGPFEDGGVVLVEADSEARLTRSEVFAADKLGDAVVRLYERYAELLPEGPERERAAATARTVAIYNGPVDLERLAAVFADDVEFIDRRTIGFGSARGAPAFLEVARSLVEAAPDATNRIDDVLGVRPHALLLRITNSGTDRATGGAFERCLLRLWVFAADGRVTRVEQFEVDHEAQALARFDELAAPRPVVPATQRRVRPNAASVASARAHAAITARDLDRVASLSHEQLEVLHHPTGRMWDRSGMLAGLRILLNAEQFEVREEPVATLGERLALSQVSSSHAEMAGDDFPPFGAVESDEFGLTEVDEDGLRRRVEWFAADHLGDALVRLYQRHAELLPEGPERERAAASAGSLAALLGPVDLERWAPALDPSFEIHDRRTLGLGRMRRDVFLDSIGAVLALSEGLVNQIDDVLAARPDALLVRVINSGTQREGGGAFERPFLLLQVFGVDGRAVRFDQFDPDREAEALARFDALAAPQPEPRAARRRVRPNAASAICDGLRAAIAAHDADALESMFSERFQYVLHETGVDLDRADFLLTWRSAFQADRLEYTLELIATLGDSLALGRESILVDGLAERGLAAFGPSQIDDIFVVEADAQGLWPRVEIFGTDRLADAIVRLYQRHAELLPEGAERERAAATARTVAVLVSREGPGGDHYVATYAPDAEFADHRALVALPPARGADEMRRRIELWFGAVEDSDISFDDVLDLRVEGLLFHQHERGHDQASGGSFEARRLLLLVFDAAGLQRHTEFFDPDREAEALARFDALVAAAPTQRPTQRRVRANAATASEAFLASAMAARDVDAIAAHAAELREVTDHRTGASYDRQGWLSMWRSLLEAQDGTYRQEPLATLGDSLALCRQWVSASGVAGERFDVGAYEMEWLLVAEVDERGRPRRRESFAADHLGDAVVCLYQRHAELLPEGPERERAQATARSLAAMPVAGPIDVDRWASAFAPDIEMVDPRTVGFGSLRGAEEAMQAVRAFRQLVEDPESQIEDIIGLRPDALLVRWTNTGTLSGGGGPFERVLSMLWVFGAHGLLTRWEQTDPEREAEALARFDALTAAPPEPRALPRRLRPNGASESAARLVAAVRARDVAAIPGLFSDDFEAVDHSTGASYGHAGAVASTRMLLEHRDLVFRQDPLATLGGRLALCRNLQSSSGVVRGEMDVGPSEIDTLLVAEVDARGLRRRNERFRSGALGDAVVRLYERHAELLPEGPERAGAAATARSVAAWLGPLDVERFAAALAPAIEVVDHRFLGTFAGRGAEAVREHLRSWVPLAADGGLFLDDVLALQAGARLVRARFSGTDRAGGGAFERVFIQLWLYGADGLATRLELFEADREAEALARFDALTSKPAPLRIENAATRWIDRFTAAAQARDWETIRACYAPEGRHVDRRRLLQVELDRDQNLAWLRDAFERDFQPSAELLATRGDRLALVRGRGAESDELVGPSENEFLSVFEVNERGENVAEVFFDPDSLDAAYAELDARFAAGEAAPHAHAWATLQHFVGAVAARDWEQLATAFAPDFVVEDHRPLGTLSALTRDEWVASARALAELRPDATLRLDHVLALDDRGYFDVGTWVGREADGAFEIQVVVVAETGSQGVRRWHLYDLGQLDAARACYDAPGARAPADPLRIPPNAATRAVERLEVAFEARDWPALRALAAPEFRFDDRGRRALVGGDVETWIRSMQVVREWPGLRRERRLLATAGERLTLDRIFNATDSGESELLRLVEVAADGRLQSLVRLDPDDRRAASVEMSESFWRGEGQRIPAAARETLRAVLDHDFERLRDLVPEDFVFQDHRRTGLVRLEGAAASVESMVALIEQAPDACIETLYTVALGEHGMLDMAHTFGTLAASGGAFENCYARLGLYRGDRIVSMEFFEPEDLERARARFEELRPAKRG